MNQTQAIAKLAKLLGPRMGYRLNKDAPSKEEREAAVLQVDELRPQVEEANHLVDARMQWLLKNDPTYQQLKAKHSELRKAYVNARGRSHHYRITVGTDDRLFFSVLAEGDNWQEVVEIVEAKKKT